MVALAAAPADCSDSSTSGASTSQGAAGKDEGVHVMGTQEAALGKRRRDVAGGLAAERAAGRSRAVRARHGATAARPTQVAAGGRTLGSDISQSHTSVLGKRDAEERGDGRAAVSGATRMRSGERKIRLELRGVAKSRPLFTSPRHIVRCSCVVWYMRLPYVGVSLRIYYHDYKCPVACRRGTADSCGATHAVPRCGRDS